MKNKKQRIAKMAEELILFAYKYGAEDLDLKIISEKSETIIKIRATNIDLDDETIESIRTLLNMPRSMEMEEYYWTLTGESYTDSELSLIGAMSDDCQINFENKILEIKLIRKSERY